MATAAISFSAMPIFLLTICCFSLWLSQAVDTLKPGEYMSETETLVSSNGVFELGFFSSGGASSSNDYLGIWFKNDQNKIPIWVANRENPIIDSSGILSIRYDGNLVITDKGRIPIIVNSGMLATSSNTSAILLDSGNLVLKERHNIAWQSFYCPSDTFLPGMKLGLFNLSKQNMREQFLVSWQSPSVPATGSFALGLDAYDRIMVWHRSGISRQIGFWDGKGVKFMFESSFKDYNFSYVSNPEEVYLTFTTIENYTSSWFVMSSSGQIQEYKMVAGQQISMVNHPICENTTSMNAIACYVKMPSMCQDEDTFSEIKGSMPNSILVNDSVHLGLSDCEMLCRGNCSCTAFASFHNDGTGCEFYYGGKHVLLGTSEEGKGSTIYVRGDNFTKALDTPIVSDQPKKRRLVLLVVIPVVSLFVLFIVSLMCFLQWRNHGYRGWMRNQDSMGGSVEQFLFQIRSNVAAVDKENCEDNFGGKKDLDLPLLRFSCIATATDNFSDANKLGEGGFGPVYKGMLLGHEIAAKRLSRLSRQGLEEFKNEVQLISKLQHRNLVRLLGCCIQREEKILIYEYMANKSLDFFLFDPSKRMLLDWKKCVCIIEGIAQGLLYLHKYSRLRIIHRDLKTSNILLDAQLNPKISDFGLARIFGEEEARAKTTRVVGTYGYMSPEYAVHGLFSIKSDVFSFGVIMLEIISGRKSVTFCHLDSSWNLLGYAWDLWKDGKGLELMDPALANSCSMNEIMLCIQVGLLCVQERPEDRPTMSDVISLLSNECTNLPAPKQPAFSTNSPRQQPNSVNDVTFSDIECR